MFGASTGFGFGAAASTPAFGAAAPATSTPFGATGATPTGFSFGGAAAASAPAFGTGTGLFGAPAAGATTSLFGAPATSAPAATSLFGAAQPATSAPAFGSSLFGAAPAATGATGFSFATPAASTGFGTSTFGQPAAGALVPVGQQQTVPPQASGAITYSTKWDELNPNAQKALVDLEQKINANRGDLEKLDMEARLQPDSAAAALSKGAVEEEAHKLRQSLNAMLNAMRADDEALLAFREKVLALLHSSEALVRTFQRSKLWRDPNAQNRAALPPAYQEMLSAPVQLPSPYLEKAISGFQDTLAEYSKVVASLEQALPPGGLSDALAAARGAGAGGLAQALPTIVSNMHDYLVHVAAMMESTHGQVAAAKAAFLAQRRRAGNTSDPFAEARRYQQLSGSGSPRQQGAYGGGGGRASTSGADGGGGGGGGSSSLLLAPAASAAQAFGGLSPGGYATPVLSTLPSGASGFMTPQPGGMFGAAAAGSDGKRAGSGSRSRKR